MGDEQLRQLLKDKYNTPINGEDCITFHHMQLVINTVRQYDKKQPSPSEVLDDVKEAVSNKYKDKFKHYQDVMDVAYSEEIICSIIDSLREKFQ